MCSALPRLRIAGTGIGLAAQVVTSTELDERFNRRGGMSQARSGVTSRRWIGPGQTTSGLAADALQQALASAGWRPDDLDVIISAGAIPERPMPATALFIARRLGDLHCEAFDVNASCLGFLEGLRVAAMGLGTGAWRRVGLVAADIASVGLNHEDIEVSSLFGDGAAAIVLESSDTGSELLAIRFRTYPQGTEMCGITAGGTLYNINNPPPSANDYLFHMDGLGVLALAARQLTGFVAELLTAAGLSHDDIDVVVPHQASSAGMAFLRRRLRFEHATIIDILADHGNQVAASLPTALQFALASGQLRQGQTVLLLGTGAGVTMGGAVLRL